MVKPLENLDSQSFQKNMMASFVQVAALVALVSYCVIIVGPFAGLVIWGLVVAVAIYPLHLKLVALLGGREKVSAGIIAAAGLALVLLPGWIAVSSMVTSVMSFSAEIKSGAMAIPPPSASVESWPLIGEPLYAAWASAADDVEGALNEFQPQVRQVSEWAVRKTGSVAIGMLQVALSIIIAGVVLLQAQSGYALSSSIATKISPNRGQHLADLTIATIRSVTNGVLGVAVIQAVLAGLGFFVMQVPHAGLLAVIVLVTSIIQVPALLIIAPIVVWVFSFAEPVPGTLFAVYSMVVALSDNVLKPILLGRGVDLPALVVLIGAIGGMLAYGIIGLFLGAVILGLGYTIGSDWLQVSATDAAQANADKSG
jgi:predicted PurR-regulated permease PerM